MRMPSASGVAFAVVLLWSTSATAIETPAARLYRSIADVCLDRYLSNNDLNRAQLHTGRPLYKCSKEFTEEIGRLKAQPCSASSPV
jgi:hypothetical protein